jgi:hypothetical protein
MHLAGRLGRGLSCEMVVRDPAFPLREDRSFTTCSVGVTETRGRCGRELHPEK